MGTDMEADIGTEMEADIGTDMEADIGGRDDIIWDKSWTLSAS